MIDKLTLDVFHELDYWAVACDELQLHGEGETLPGALITFAERLLEDYKNYIDVYVGCEFQGGYEKYLQATCTKWGESEVESDSI